MKKIAILTYLILVFVGTGCRKFVEVEPPKTDLSSEVVFSDNTTAAAVLTGLYNDMSGVYYNSGSVEAVSAFSGLSADELLLQNPSSDELPIQLFTNQLSKNSDGNIWKSTYMTIFRCNAALEGINRSSSLSEHTKNVLLGECYFLRAFYYFHLVNLYGGVPLALNTDFKINSSLVRASTQEVYQQIINDLNRSISLLPKEYLGPDVLTSTTNRVRPNQYTAKALLARVYLYTEKWKLAEEVATDIVNQSAIYNLETLSNVFTSTSREAIWQLQPVTPNGNTLAGLYFFISNDSFSSVQPVSLTNQLAESFDLGDKRKMVWINSISLGGKNYYYPTKYRNVPPNFGTPENTMVFRLAEQYLIRAEARCQLNDFAGFNQDINAIRSRAGLIPVNINNLPDAMDEIIKERKLEFFTEWGHRWFDLKRTGRVDSVMSAFESIKGGQWQSTDQLYPIPTSELLLNNKLTQNPGY